METEYEQLVRVKRERQQARSIYSASLTDAKREEDGRCILEAWKKLPLKMKCHRTFDGEF